MAEAIIIGLFVNPHESGQPVRPDDIQVSYATGATTMQGPSALVLGLLTLSVLSLAGITVPGLADADVNDLRPGQWSGGVGAGFLTNTPDGVEFALKGHVDYTHVMPGFYLGVRF
jgi:hypothetical protein